MELEENQRIEFERTVRDTSAYFFTLSYRLTGSYEEAQDLLQETWIKAWNSWNQLKDKNKALPWIRRICVNHYIDLNRKSKRAVPGKDRVFPHMEYEIASDLPTPEDEVLADEQVRLIHSQCWTILTGTLPLYQQAALVLADVYKLGIDEVALLLDRSRGAVKSLLHRARETLSGRLSPFCSLLHPDNICKCKSWIKYSHDIERRREFLKDLATAAGDPDYRGDSVEEKVIALFNSLPLHSPPEQLIGKTLKKII